MQRKIAVLLAAAVAAAAAQGPTPRQLLEAATYLQNTTGHNDEAIVTFRGVIAAGAPVEAGLAQTQIVSALLSKGACGAAAGEFKTLITAYGDQSDLMALVANRLSGREAGTPPPPGTAVAAPPGAPALKSGLAQVEAVSALLRKGDLAAASQAFQALVAPCAERDDLIVLTSKRLSGPIGKEPEASFVETLGAPETVYVLKSSGATIKLPPGWKEMRRNGKDGVFDDVDFQDQRTNFRVEFHFEPMPKADSAADPSGALKAVVDAWVRERVANSFLRCTLLPETMKTWDVQGRQAFSVVAEGGPSKAEYFRQLTAVNGTKWRFLAVAWIAKGQWDAYLERVDQLIAGVTVP